MKVLITGGTSLAGNLLATDLTLRGDEVTSFQRTAAKPAVGREVLGEISAEEDVVNAVAGMDVVVHLAAKVGVVGSWEEFERVNVIGTRVLLEAAKQAGVTRFIYISSPSVAHSGGALVGVGAATADPTATRGHYSTTKAMAELLALECSSSEMPVVVLRPHLIWGPGDTQLVGRIIERSRAGRLPLIGSGAALIDSVYVSNAVDAIVAAIDKCPELAGRVLVVSNGQPRTVSELFGRIVSSADLSPPKRKVPFRLAYIVGVIAEWLWAVLNRTDDPPMTSFMAEQLSTAHWFDQRETGEALDWEPQISLEEGFRLLRASL